MLISSKASTSTAQQSSDTENGGVLVVDVIFCISFSRATTLSWLETGATKVGRCLFTSGAVKNVGNMFSGCCASAVDELTEESNISMSLSTKCAGANGARVEIGGSHPRCDAQRSDLPYFSCSNFSRNWEKSAERCGTVAVLLDVLHCLNAAEPARVFVESISHAISWGFSNVFKMFCTLLLPWFDATVVSASSVRAPIRFCLNLAARAFLRATARLSFVQHFGSFVRALQFAR